MIPRQLLLLPNWWATPSACGISTSIPSATPAATSADLWNSYKDTLHTRLYRATLERLKLGAALDASHEEKKQMTQQELIAQNMPGDQRRRDRARISACCPTAISSTPTRARSRLHIQMVNRLLKSITAPTRSGSLRPVDRLAGRPQPLATRSSTSSPGTAPGSSTSWPAPSASPG